MKTREVTFPVDSQPYIQKNHTDGPLLICADGTPHFLTTFEQIQLHFGFTTVEKLNRVYAVSDEPCRA